MWLVDELAEQHIKAALEKGELSNLPGSGKPLQLDDDSHVPPELRAGYRLLKIRAFCRQSLNSDGKPWKLTILFATSILRIKIIRIIAIGFRCWS